MSDNQDSPSQCGLSPVGSEGGGPSDDADLQRPIADLTATAGARPGSDPFSGSQNAILAALLEKLDGLSSEVSELKPAQHRAPDRGSSQREVTPLPPVSDRRAEGGDPPHQEEGSAAEQSGSSNTTRPPSEFVPLSVYRHKIRPGFERHRPLGSGLDRPHYFEIDDPVTRSLSEKKHTARLAEYTTVTAHGYFTACSNEALVDAIRALEHQKPNLAYGLLLQILNSQTVVEDMLRDRRAFLQIVGNPTSDDNKLDYARKLMSSQFNPHFDGIGASEENNDIWRRYCTQVDSSTIQQSAKSRALHRFQSNESNKPSAGGGRAGKGGQQQETPKKQQQPKGKIQQEERHGNNKRGDNHNNKKGGKSNDKAPEDQ